MRRNFFPFLFWLTLLIVISSCTKKDIYWPLFDGMYLDYKIERDKRIYFYHFKIKSFQEGFLITLSKYLSKYDEKEKLGMIYIDKEGNILQTTILKDGYEKGSKWVCHGPIRKRVGEVYLRNWDEEYKVKEIGIWKKWRTYNIEFEKGRRYYEINTGIMVGGVEIVYDEKGKILNVIRIKLIDTNVPELK
jgi:hypothetical protein